jgi:hypothetical protein
MSDGFLLEGLGHRGHANFAVREELCDSVAAVQLGDRLANILLILRLTTEVPALGFRIGVPEDLRVFDRSARPKVGSCLVPKRLQRRIGVLPCVRLGRKVTNAIRFRLYKRIRVECLPNRPEPIHIGMMEPEGRIESTDIELAHVACAISGFIARAADVDVNPVMKPFKTAVFAGIAVLCPRVVAECVELFVREQDEGSATAKRGAFVEYGGGDGAVVRLPGSRVRPAKGVWEVGPLGDYSVAVT